MDKSQAVNNSEMAYPIKYRIKQSIRASKSKVFVRADFEKFGGYDQVGRALRELVNDGQLVRMGYGVYVKARVSPLSGKPVPTAFLTEVGLQLMKKLGVKADVGHFQRLYRDGRSTQIPMKDIIATNKPVKRKIKWGKRELGYERY